MNAPAADGHKNIIPLMWAKSGTFITSYLLLLLFANMYGFWGVFDLNLFSFGNILELITNASLFVAHAVILWARLLVAVFVALWFAVIVTNWVGQLIGSERLRDFSLHVWLTKLDQQGNTAELIVLFVVIGIYCQIVRDAPYSTMWFVYFIFASIGIAVAESLTFGRAAG